MKPKLRQMLSAGGLALAGQAAGLAGAGAAWAAGRQARPFRIFMILFRGETAVEKGFRAYLEERGVEVEWIVRDVALDIRKVPQLVAEARALRADLVYTWGSPVTLAVAGSHKERDPARHITDIPVLFTMVAAPVGSGLVASLASSGRNLTGTCHVVPIGQQLGAMRAYHPFQTLAVLFNPAEPAAALTVRQLREEARRERFTLLEQPVGLNAQGQPQPESLPRLVARIAASKPQLLYLGPDSFIAANRKAVTDAALEHRLPVFSATEIAIRDAKGLFGLVSRYENVGRLTARKAEQILLQGMRPQEIPIETLARFSYIVNMAVAAKLDFYPPLKVVNYAEVIR